MELQSHLPVQVLLAMGLYTQLTATKPSFHSLRAVLKLHWAQTSRGCWKWWILRFPPQRLRTASKVMLIPIFRNLTWTKPCLTRLRKTPCKGTILILTCPQKWPACFLITNSTQEAKVDSSSGQATRQRGLSGGRDRNDPWTQFWMLLACGFVSCNSRHVIEMYLSDHPIHLLQTLDGSQCESSPRSAKQTFPAFLAPLSISAENVTVQYGKTLQCQPLKESLLRTLP